MRLWKVVSHDDLEMTNYIKHKKSGLVVQFLENGQVEVKSDDGTVAVYPQVGNVVRVESRRHC